MKLQNKETGQVENFCIDKDQIRSCDGAFVYDSLAQLQEAGWEDYEEPKGIIGICQCLPACPSTVYIEMATEEEAEKAVEKLKAWKRLRDKGFKFEGIKEDYTRILQNQEPFRTGKRYLQFNKSEDEEWMKENWEDLDLLFGGEE